MSGAAHVAPGCDNPLMTTGCVMSGRIDVGAMVFTPAPAILKAMVARAPLAFASKIACRRLPAPELFVLVTTKAGSATATQAENSDVSNGAVFLVAVAVM